MPKITALLGDSTIDNSHWNRDGFSVPEILKAKMPDCEIMNFAVDGFTTQDVLVGAKRNKAVRDDQHQNEMSYPLDNLVINKNIEYVVLSVGGNDFREAIGQLGAMSPVNATEKIIEIIRQIQSRYLSILDQIQKINPSLKIILATQYIPCTIKDNYDIYALMGQLLPPHNQSAQAKVALLQYFMQQLYPPIFERAARDRMAIIDLTNSMNYNDINNYVLQIEPSAKGGELITDLIAHVINNHNFNDVSKVYSKPFDALAEIQAHENDGLWVPNHPVEHTERDYQYSNKPSPNHNFFINYLGHVTCKFEQMAKQQQQVPYANYFWNAAFSRQINCLTPIRDAYDYTDNVIFILTFPIAFVIDLAALLCKLTFQLCKKIGYHLGLTENEGNLGNPLLAAAALPAYLIRGLLNLVDNILSLITRPVITLVKGYEPQTEERFLLNA